MLDYGIENDYILKTGLEMIEFSRDFQGYQVSASYSLSTRALKLKQIDESLPHTIAFFLAHQMTPKSGLA